MSQNLLQRILQYREGKWRVQGVVATEGSGLVSPRGPAVTQDPLSPPSFRIVLWLKKHRTSHTFLPRVWISWETEAVVGLQENGPGPSCRRLGERKVGGPATRWGSLSLPEAVSPLSWISHSVQSIFKIVFYLYTQQLSMDLYDSTNIQNYSTETKTKAWLINETRPDYLNFQMIVSRKQTILTFRWLLITVRTREKVSICQSLFQKIKKPQISCKY